MTAMVRLSLNATASARMEAANMPTCLQIVSTDDPLSECDLAGSRWVVTEIAGKKVPANLVPTLEFRSDGRLFGTAAINRFTMDYVQDGWCVSVGLAFATRCALDPGRAEFETMLLQCLETIRQFRRDEQTLSVIFETRDGREIRTRPVVFR